MSLYPGDSNTGGLPVVPVLLLAVFTFGLIYLLPSPGFGLPDKSDDSDDS